MKTAAFHTALIVLVGISCSSGLGASEVRFQASVDKSKVGVGERFTLSFDLENAGMGGGENIRFPDLSDFYVLSGPNQSSSIQFINGKVSSSVSYNYVLQPKKTGSFTIGSATVEVDKRTYSTRPVRIEVVSGRQVPGGSQAPKSNPPDVGDEIADNLFLKATVDKDHVVQGEQVNLTYKVYTRLNISDYAIHKVPPYTGFWAEEAQREGDLPLTTEVVDGREFRVGVIKQVALFPTRPGELGIDPLEIETAVQVRRSRRRDPFSSFFDDPFESFFRDPFGRTVRYMLRSDPVTIHVDPLPAGAPSDFHGAVGSFRMEVTIDKSVSKVNEPINLRVSLEGKGNIKLLEAPDLVIPSSLESYPPKVTDQVRRTDGTIEGTKTFEYLMIPRSPGRFRIAPIRYAFFEPSGGKYVTLRSKGFDIEIEGAGQLATSPQGGAPRADVEVLTKDIRFIKLTDLDLDRRGEFLFARPSFIALVLLSFVAFLGTLVYGKRIERTREDVSLRRRRRARKEARKRLKHASEALREGRAEVFYPRVSQAVWGYLGDRLNIDPGQYSLDRISDTLTGRGVPEGLLAALRELLEACSMASYGGGGSETREMGEFLERTKTILSDLERVLR